MFPCFSSVLPASDPFRDPLAEFRIPRQVREFLPEQSAVGSRFHANRGVSAEFARLAEFRASPAERQRRPWFVVSSRNSPRFLVNRARSAKAQNGAWFCMVPRNPRGSRWNARGPRRHSFGGCCEISITLLCYFIGLLRHLGI